MDTSLPKAADNNPIEVELKGGETYYFCTCGLSEKQPFCDGAHKGTGYKSFPFTPEEDKKAWLCMCKKTQGQPFCDGSHTS